MYTTHTHTHTEQANKLLSSSSLIEKNMFWPPQSWNSICYCCWKSLPLKWSGCFGQLKWNLCLWLSTCAPDHGPNCSAGKKITHWNHNGYHKITTYKPQSSSHFTLHLYRIPIHKTWSDLTGECIKGIMYRYKSHHLNPVMTTATMRWRWMTTPNSIENCKQKATANRSIAQEEFWFTLCASGIINC